MITAETKKTRYTSYHCTHCKGRYAKEEELAPLFDEIIQAVQLDPSIRSWLVNTVKWSRHDEREYQRETLARLQADLLKIKTRLDALYVDKLDGKVSENFWIEKIEAMGVRTGKDCR